MPKFFFNYSVDSACPYHRLLLPARYCRDEMAARGVELVAGEGMPPGYDVYFFHGLANQDGVLAFQKLKNKGAKFVWSVDDDWLTIPDWNPAKPDEDGIASYHLLKGLADWVLTSTPHLARTFSDVGRKVLCAPNLMDVSAFPEVPYTTMPDGSRNYAFDVRLPVRVVWTGGVTHKKDVEVMTEAADMVLDRLKGKAVVVYQGMSPPAPLLTKYLHRGLFHQKSVPFASYQSILNSVQANVYLAPLAKVDFNLAKSNLRVMEGWCLMAPPVATPWGEYNCIQSGVDGRYADSPDEWYSAIHRLVTDHPYRLTMAAEGRKRVEESYSWAEPSCRVDWVNAFTRIAEGL